MGAESATDLTLFGPKVSLGEAQHAASLTRAAASALQEKRPADAYALADRRCRIRPSAGAEHFMLRAAALAQLGEQAAAQNDVEHALKLDPDHALANRALLRSGDPAVR